MLCTYLGATTPRYTDSNDRRFPLEVSSIADSGSPQFYSMVLRWDAVRNAVIPLVRILNLLASKSSMVPRE